MGASTLVGSEQTEGEKGRGELEEGIGNNGGVKVRRQKRTTPRQEARLQLDRWLEAMKGKLITSNTRQAPSVRIEEVRRRIKQRAQTRPRVGESTAASSGDIAGACGGNEVTTTRERDQAKIRIMYAQRPDGMEGSEAINDVLAWLSVVGGAAAFHARAMVEEFGDGWQVSIVTSRNKCERLMGLPLGNIPVGNSYPTKVGGVEPFLADVDMQESHAGEPSARENRAEAGERRRGDEKEGLDSGFMGTRARDQTKQAVYDQRHGGGSQEGGLETCAGESTSKKRRLRGKQRQPEEEVGRGRSSKRRSNAEAEANHGSGIGEIKRRRLTGKQSETIGVGERQHKLATTKLRRSDAECGGHKRKRRRSDEH